VSREAAARGLTTRCSLPSREKRYQILSRSAVFATNRKAATSPKVSEALYVLFGRTNAQRATSDTSRIYRAYRLESTSLSARIASSTPTRQNIQNSVDRHNLVRVVSRTLRPPTATGRRTYMSGEPSNEALGRFSIRATRRAWRRQPSPQGPSANKLLHHTITIKMRTHAHERRPAGPSSNAFALLLQRETNNWLARTGTKSLDIGCSATPYLTDDPCSA
jgi:hypothetical protein